MQFEASQKLEISLKFVHFCAISYCYTDKRPQHWPVRQGVKAEMTLMRVDA